MVRATSGQEAEGAALLVAVRMVTVGRQLAARSGFDPGAAVAIQSDSRLAVKHAVSGAHVRARHNAHWTIPLRHILSGSGASVKEVAVPREPRAWTEQSTAVACIAADTAVERQEM
jgi:hypothetical protein